jgi:hypothetical protein
VEKDISGDVIRKGGKENPFVPIVSVIIGEIQQLLKNTG